MVKLIINQQLSFSAMTKTPVHRVQWTQGCTRISPLHMEFRCQACALSSPHLSLSPTTYLFRVGAGLPNIRRGESHQLACTTPVLPIALGEWGFTHIKPLLEYDHFRVQFQNKTPYFLSRAWNLLFLYHRKQNQLERHFYYSKCHYCNSNVFL